MFNDLSPKDMLKFKDKQKYQDKFEQTQNKKLVKKTHY